MQSAKMINYLSKNKFDSNIKFQFHTVLTDYLSPFKIKKLRRYEKILDQITIKI